MICILLYPLYRCLNGAPDRRPTSSLQCRLLSPAIEDICSRNRCWRFEVAAGVLDRSVDVISVHATKERACRLLAQGVNAIERASLGRSKAGHGSRLDTTFCAPAWRSVLDLAPDHYARLTAVARLMQVFALPAPGCERRLT